MSGPELWIVAGPNGGGKTTCVQKEPIAGLLPRVAFLNPDDRTLLKLRERGFQGFFDAPVELQSKLFSEAADEVAAELDSAVLQNRAVGIETVLSTSKYCPIVEGINSGGGSVGLIYIALHSPNLAVERVAARVTLGGHGVPKEKIVQRWRHSLENLPWFAARSRAFWVFDNSNSNVAVAPLLLASGKSGMIEHCSTWLFAEMEAALKTLPRR